jgi:hypothetical protein
MSQQSLTKIAVCSFVFALAGLLGTHLLQAAPEGRGSVSGRVTYEDGKPVVGLALRLEKFQPMGLGEPGTGRRKNNIAEGSGAVGLQSEKGTKIIARVSTDQNGNFTMTNVEAGGATLVGGNQKIGWIYPPLEIKANEETKLGDIKLVKTD